MRFKAQGGGVREQHGYLKLSIGGLLSPPMLSKTYQPGKPGGPLGTLVRVQQNTGAGEFMSGPFAFGQQG
jgi:hypothetical protein